LGEIASFFVSRVALDGAHADLITLQVEVSESLIFELDSGSSKEGHVRTFVHQHTSCIALAQKIETTQEATIISIPRKYHKGVSMFRTIQN
jgi:hypothetical protein